MAVKQTKIITNDNELSLDQLREVSLSNQLQTVDGFDDNEKTDDDMLNDVLSELGGASDVKVNVYLLESGKPQAFVGSYAPDAFSIDAIQASYGAGEYSIQVRANGKIKTRRVIRIAKPRTELNTSNSGLDGLNMIRESIEKSNQLMLETVRQALQAAQSPQKSTQDMLNELLLMKQVMGGGEKSGLDMKDFLQMLEVAKGLVPTDQKEATTNDILLEGLKGLAPVLAQGMMQPRAQIPQQIPARQAPVYQPSNNPVEKAPIENPIEQQPLNSENAQTVDAVESDIDMQLQERLFFNLLIANAAKDNDPVPYANMLLDIVGNDQAEQLLNDPNWFTALINKDARCQNYEAWFNELRTAILDIVADEKNMLTQQNGGDINNVNTVITDNVDANSQPTT